MGALAFDTHKAVKALKESGFSDRQAEAVVATVGDAITEGLASKADIAEVRTELKTDIAEVRTELKADIAEVKAEVKADVAEVKADIADVRAEVKADIAEVKTDVARLETRIEASAKRNLLAMIAVGGLIVAAIKLL